VVQHSQPAEQLDELERPRDAVPAARVGAFGQPVTPKDDLAGVRGDLPCDQAKQRGLARAVGAHEPHRLARVHVKGDVVDGPEPPVPLGHVTDLQQDAHGALSLTLADSSGGRARKTSWDSRRLANSKMPSVCDAYVKAPIDNTKMVSVVEPLDELPRRVGR
jgi:hypothetical protein